MSKRQDYVVGFAIDTDRRLVALIKKNRPSWQCGKLNGIGGRIEKGETPGRAMAREFEEEAGVKTLVSDWRKLILLKFRGGKVWSFVTESVGTDSGLKSMTDEPVEWYQADAIQDLYVVPNLSWLIPLAFDKEKVYGEIKDPS